MRSAATPYSPADEAREDHDTAMAEHDAEVAAKALRDAAKEFTDEMGHAWGGHASWLTTGHHIANLAADVLLDRAARIESGDLP